ncbi:keywimysin-related RiPP [Actinoplanes sp. RD1]|nr:lasso RiPP family leader peptide-containing protein [Actinoplanes sp. RD1]
MSETYESPVLTELGDFAAETGYYDERNNDEIVWFFDNWG